VVGRLLLRNVVSFRDGLHFISGESLFDLLEIEEDGTVPKLQVGNFFSLNKGTEFSHRSSLLLGQFENIQESRHVA